MPPVKKEKEYEEIYEADFKCFFKNNDKFMFGSDFCFIYRSRLRAIDQTNTQRHTGL
jgi:hypothetical protein